MASSEAQNKTNNRYHPEENRPRSAAHNVEGCRSVRALPKPQWADIHGSLNGMLHLMSQCISVEKFGEDLRKDKGDIPIQKFVQCINGHPLYMALCS